MLGRAPWRLRTQRFTSRPRAHIPRGKHKFDSIPPLPWTALIPTHPANLNRKWQVGVGTRADPAELTTRRRRLSGQVELASCQPMGMIERRRFFEPIPAHSREPDQGVEMGTNLGFRGLVGRPRGQTSKRYAWQGTVAPPNATVHLPTSSTPLDTSTNSNQYRLLAPPFQCQWSALQAT